MAKQARDRQEVSASDVGSMDEVLSGEGEEGVSTPLSSSSKVKKTVCPISKEEFEEEAQELTIKIGDQTKIAAVKFFSSGSFGWYCGDKVTVEVGGVEVKAQLSLNLTVIGSKPKK